MTAGTHTDHEPTPEFRARLEWQVETALRRQQRFDEPAVPPRWRLRTAALVVAALLVGGAGGRASGYAQENRARGQLLESNRSDASLIQLRLELVRAEVEQARKRVAAGVADRQTLAAAEDQLHALETSLARNRLDAEEIQATSAAPRNDLQAPLVGQRDFVRERLMLDLSTAQRALAAAEQDVARTRQRFDVGLAQSLDMQQADADLLRERTRMQTLAATLDLRQRALQGELKGDEVAIAVQRVELTLHLQQLQQDLKLAQARLDEARRRVAVGAGSEIDVKLGELQVLERQLDMQRLQQQLQALRK